MTMTNIDANLQPIEKIGKVFWVGKNDKAPPHGTGPSDENPGTPLRPFATLKYAVTRCVSGRSDTIHVYPGHVESVTTISGILIEVDALTVIFLGSGTNTATIDFNASTTASIRIRANDVVLINPRFISNIDALGLPIIINHDAAGCKIINAVYQDADGVGTRLALESGGDRTTIDGWVYIPGDELGSQKNGGLRFTSSAGAMSVDLNDIDITGDFSLGNIITIGTSVEMNMTNVQLNNLSAVPDPTLDIGSQVTGWAKNVDFRVASGTTYVATTAAINWDTQCLGYNTDGKGGTPIATFA